MVKYKYIFVALCTCLFASCSDDSPEAPPALASRLNSLARTLDGIDTCDEKADTISFWLSTYRDEFESEYDSFRDSCPVGKSSSYQCMSHMLLSSGRVEVALGDCKDNQHVKNSVVLLNQRAGLNICGWRE